MNISEYTYALPEEKIAKYPLPQRDRSKLLVYQKGHIRHSHFYTLAEHLPDSSFLFFNNTKVIPARLYFQKETGAVIEIFLLNPVSPSPLIAETMGAARSCVWHCTIGNLKKWNDHLVLGKVIGEIQLSASLQHRAEGLIEFVWDSDARV